MGIVDEIRAGKSIEGATEEVLWAEALYEVQSDQRRDGIWAKALADVDGDKEKAEAWYMKFRVRELRQEVRSAISERKKLSEQAALTGGELQAGTKSDSLGKHPTKMPRLRSTARGVLLGGLTSVATTAILLLFHVFVVRKVSQMYGIPNPLDVEPLPVMTLNWILVQLISCVGAFAGGFISARNGPARKWTASIFLSGIYLIFGLGGLAIGPFVGIEVATTILFSICVFVGAVIYAEKFEQSVNQAD